MQTVDRHDVGVRLQRALMVLLVVYVYDASADNFQALPDMPRDLPLQIHNARQALQLIDKGNRCDAAHSPAAAAAAAAAAAHD